MCEPISASTLAYVGIASAVASAGVAAYGQAAQSQAASAAASARAQQDQNNAVLAGRAATDALARGDVNAQAKANQENALAGRQKVGLAANGVDVNSGSSVDLESDVAGSGELDQLTIHSNAMREAAGYQSQGMNYTTQASIDEASSQNATSAGALAATGSLISGAGSVASQWYGFKNGTRGYGVSGGL